MPLAGKLIGCAIAAVAIASPVTAGAVTTVSYYTGTPACTTKEAVRTTNSAPRPSTVANDSWMDTAMPSQLPARFPRGQTPNDDPMLSTFPTTYVQPVDDVRGGKAAPAIPATIALGKQIVLLVSTCPNPG